MYKILPILLCLSMLSCHSGPEETRLVNTISVTQSQVIDRLQKYDPLCYHLKYIREELGRDLDKVKERLVNNELSTFEGYLVTKILIHSSLNNYLMELYFKSDNYIDRFDAYCSAVYIFEQWEGGAKQE